MMSRRQDHRFHRHHLDRRRRRRRRLSRNHLHRMYSIGRRRLHRHDHLGRHVRRYLNQPEHLEPKSLQCGHPQHPLFLLFLQRL